MTKPKMTICFVSLLLSTAILPRVFADPPAAGSVERVERDDGSLLFDGKTLEGWEGNRQVFRVENGAIVAGTLKKPIPHNEFLCTSAEYSDFELRLEAKLVGKGTNAGVQFRSRRIPHHFEVMGYQCDVGFAGKRCIWGSLYDESRRRRFLVDGDSPELRNVLHPDDWNELIIRCQDDRIQIWVNGHQTADYQETNPKIAQTGVIGLQIHGGPPATCSYRRIRIKDLTQRE